MSSTFGVLLMALSARASVPRTRVCSLRVRHRMGIRVLRMLRRLVVAESVSAANEVKLTETERGALDRSLEDSGCHGFLGDHPNLYAATERILGARLSAREPDNEAVEQLTAFRAECEAVGIPYDAAGLVRHHRGNAAMAATLDALAAVPVSGVPTEAVRELAERVRELHDERTLHPWADESHSVLDKSVVLAAYCGECTPDDTLAMIEDDEWTEDWPLVAYPCPTIALVQRAAETNESGTP